MLLDVDGHGYVVVGYIRCCYYTRSTAPTSAKYLVIIFRTKIIADVHDSFCSVSFRNVCEMFRVVKARFDQLSRHHFPAKSKAPECFMSTRALCLRSALRVLLG